jgi:hypothetical protein
MKGYNKSAVEKYLKFYDNKERYISNAKVQQRIQGRSNFTF